MGNKSRNTVNSKAPALDKSFNLFISWQSTGQQTQYYAKTKKHCLWSLHFSPNSVATLGVLAVRVKSRWLIDMISGAFGKSGDPRSTKAPASSVFNRTLARNGGPETSRTTLSSLWASQVALFVLRCEFCDRSRNPLTLGLSDRSRCGAVQFLDRFGRARSLSLWRGASFGIARATLLALWACQIALVAARCSVWQSRRSCAEILARRSFLESLPRHLDTERSCTETLRPL